MKTLRWAIASSLVSVLFAGTALAQVTMSSPVQQPGSIQQMGFQSDDFAGYAVVDPAPAPAGAAAAPASPSNQPPAPPPAPPAAKAEEKPAAEKPKEEKKEEEKKEEEKPAEEGPVKIFHGPWLDCEHLDIRGYFDAGYTDNPTWPLSRFNGPDGYNDLADTAVLDQLYLIAERVTKVENDCGIDYGYRADVMFGTDAHFTQTTKGTFWDSTWSGGSPYYGLAMPQLYGQLQYNKLTLQGGHYLAPCGLENVMPTENFFYSHTYGFLYGMPTTLTGGEATYKVKDKLLLFAGFDTGWNNFDTLNGKLNAMFGANWTSPDKDGKINVVSYWFIGNMSNPGVEGTRTEACTDVTLKLGDKWQYVLENTTCHDSNDSATGGPASWTGFSNYLIYAINDCWGFGIRYEYFEDLDGAVVPGIGLGGVATQYPTAVAPNSLIAPVLGSKYNDLTLGLNWKPNKNVTMRTEVRWDWASNGPGAGSKPYDDGASNSQFLWGNDIVVRF